MEHYRSSGLGLLLVTVSYTVRASDQDLTTDFGISAMSASNFTLTGFRNLQAGSHGVATPTFASFEQLPGLTGLGFTAVQIQFGPQSQVSPHSHPRATETFYVLSGTGEEGFGDTNNELFETALQTSDLFVFPKGQDMHFERNNGSRAWTGFSALFSDNPGILLVSSALFTAGDQGLPDIVLATALGTSVQTVDGIKSALSSPAAAPGY